MTDADLLNLVGASPLTPTHSPVRCFVADLRRVYEAGKRAQDETVVIECNLHPECAVNPANGGGA